MVKRATKDIPKDKLAEFKAKHFALKGREQRIAKALEILNRAGPTFKLDRKTVKWIAQDNRCMPIDRITIKPDVCGGEPTIRGIELR